MSKRKVYIIDFDSTLVQVEALDELARIALERAPDRDEIVSEISRITQLGMEGRISIHESLTERLALIQPTKKHIDELVKLLKKRITPSFARNRDFLKKFSKDIYVFTAGFKEYVLPIIKELGLKPENTFANSFTFNKKGAVGGFDRKNFLSQPGGKIKQLKALKIKGDISVIGDGFTDLEMKESGLVNTFYAFTENVEREIVTRNADHIVRSLDEVLFHNKLPISTSYPKSKIRVLLLEGTHPKGVENFEREGYQVEVLSDALSEAELSKKIKEVSLLGIRSKTQVSERILKSAEKLIGIGAFCIGTDQVNLSACAGRGIVVFNAPFSNTRSVVELAIGEIIMLIRRIFEASTKLHQGTWHKSSSGSFEVRGKKLGIIGYGNIGSQLSVIAEGLGMEVYFYDVVDKLALGNAKRCKSLHDLLKVSDIVTCHVDGRASNANLIGEKEFQTMKDGVIFLNLSRGSVVTIAALVSALRKKKVAGAAIDVFPKEPNSNREEFISELRGIPNVILTPHIGGSTLEAQENIAEYVSKKLIDYVNTGSSFFSVNFPNIQLPTLHKAHRLLHVHRNVPGILAEINGALAKNKTNILGQYLKTTDEIGYVITDVDKQYDSQITNELKKIPHTIKFRILY